MKNNQGSWVGIYSNPTLYLVCLNEINRQVLEHNPWRQLSWRWVLLVGHWNREPGRRGEHISMLLDSKSSTVHLVTLCHPKIPLNSQLDMQDSSIIDHFPGKLIGFPQVFHWFSGSPGVTIKHQGDPVVASQKKVRRSSFSGCDSWPKKTSGYGWINVDTVYIYIA